VARVDHSQKGSFYLQGLNGTSEWYMVKDASNNWALNSAIGGLDSFKAYQSTNSGDTYIDASNSSGTVRVNYEQDPVRHSTSTWRQQLFVCKFCRDHDDQVSRARGGTGHYAAGG